MDFKRSQKNEFRVFNKVGSGQFCIPSFIVPVCIIEDQNVCCEERLVRNVIIVLKFNRIREPPFA